MIFAEFRLVDRGLTGIFTDAGAGRPESEFRIMEGCWRIGKVAAGDENTPRKQVKGRCSVAEGELLRVRRVVWANNAIGSDTCFVAHRLFVDKSALRGSFWSVGFARNGGDLTV